ncbi:MAG: hypothetical protein QOE82_1663 [Thermoanaerobaculia bacterium]|nr:hypothetical protein [Thermoanaerobaculia bacterium]
MSFHVVPDGNNNRDGYQLIAPARPPRDFLASTLAIRAPRIDRARHRCRTPRRRYRPAAVPPTPSPPVSIQRKSSDVSGPRFHSRRRSLRPLRDEQTIAGERDRIGRASSSPVDHNEMKTPASRPAFVRAVVVIVYGVNASLLRGIRSTSFAFIVKSIHSGIDSLWRMRNSDSSSSM